MLLGVTPRLRDLERTELGDYDDTPADTYERRTMALIARRTRRVLFLMLALCTLSFLTSAGALAYQLTVWSDQRKASRGKLDEILERLREHRR